MYLSCLNAFNVSGDSTFDIIDSINTLNHEKLEILRAFADRTYNQLSDFAKAANEDLKIVLNKFDLVLLVGIEAVSKLELIFGENYD